MLYMCEWANHVDEGSYHDPGDGDGGYDESGHVVLDQEEREANQEVMFLVVTSLRVMKLQ